MCAALGLWLKVVSGGLRMATWTAAGASLASLASSFALAQGHCPGGTWALVAAALFGCCCCLGGFILGVAIQPLLRGDLWGRLFRLAAQAYLRGAAGLVLEPGRPAAQVLPPRRPAYLPGH